jgi:nuclear-control-of-ATPase protein 2
MSISHITNKLFLSSSPSQWAVSQASLEPSLSSTVNSSKDILRSLFLSLSPPFSPNRARDIIKYLQKVEDGNRLAERYASRNIDGEEQALKDAVLSRLVAATYAEALDTLLSEAIAAEVEAQWWADLERSRLRVAYHLVQSTSSSSSCLLVVHPSDCVFSLAPPHFQFIQGCTSHTTFQ